MPRTVSKTEIATNPITRTSSVLMLRCTSTLSMTTWKKTGEISAKSWRKNEATSTSLNSPRYLWTAPRNQVTSNRLPRSVSLARRVIRTRRPSHTASSSARVISVGRWESGAWTRILSSLALPSSRNPPSRKAAIAGRGVRASRSHRVLDSLAFRPSCRAQHRISGTPIASFPNVSPTEPGPGPLVEQLGQELGGVAVVHGVEGIGMARDIERAPVVRGVAPVESPAHRRQRLALLGIGEVGMDLVAAVGVGVRRHGILEPALPIGRPALPGHPPRGEFRGFFKDGPVVPHR